MTIAFNKITYAIANIAEGDQFSPVEDWIIDPVFDDYTRAMEYGPNFWVITGNNIHAMTDEEMDVDQATLDHVKAWRRQKINELRETKFTNGFTDSYDIKWSTSPNNVANINAVCTLISLGVITTDQVWRDFDNVDHTMTISQLIQLAAEMAIFGKTCYEVGWYHKANIDALTTVSDVLNYDFSAGWPS